MSPESRRMAGVLLILMPTVVFGGVSLLTLLVGDPRYVQNPLREEAVGTDEPEVSHAA